MEIKFTPQGLLIYATMLAYLAAFLLFLLKRRTPATAVYACGFVIAAVSFGFRWWHVEHIPLQNLFEIFLCLGLLMFPLSLCCKRLLGAGGVAADVLIGLVILFPAGLVFSAEPKNLRPALQSPLFAPHVLVYMVAYVVMAKAAVQAVFQLIKGNSAPQPGLVSHELATYRLIQLGFPLLTCGLALGAWWGKLAWGDYWNWDPKELWSLASWLVYVGYFHFRYMHGRKFARANATIAVAGMALIVITLLWVNLARIFSGLHNYAS